MTGSKMRLNILYQFNEKYVPYAGVSITSLLQNNQSAEAITVYILGEGLSKEAVETLNQAVSSYHREVVYLDADNLIFKMKELDMPTYRGSYAANMRLFLDEVLDESVDRILYLDSDTVVNADLSSLLSLDMQGKTIGMVLDSLGEAHKLQIGLGEADEYFNSGVILYDLKQWRQKGYSERIIRHVREQRNNYPAPDQDLLNVVCRGDIFRLDLRYNFQPVHAAFSDRQYYRVMKPMVYYDRETIQAAMEQVSIYHCFRFLGEFPWHEGNLHPYNEIFDRYLAVSLWKNYRKEKTEAGLPIKIEKVLYRILPKGIFLPIFKVAHRMFLNRANSDSLKNETNKLM